MRPQTLLLVVGLLALSIAGTGIAAATPSEDALAAYARDDYAAALALFRPLADQGDVTAQFALGMMYQKGQGVPKDEKAAYKWFRRAAEQGDPASEWIVGAMLANGAGVAKDLEEAVKWYRLAAAQGDADAQHFLGVALANGKGVKRDDTLGYMWLEVAAWQGNAEAAKKLDVLASDMTPAQIENGKMMAYICEQSKYKDCE